MAVGSAEGIALHPFPVGDGGCGGHVPAWRRYS